MTQLIPSDSDSCLADGVLHHSHEPRPASTMTEAAQIFSALGDPARLRLLELLYDGTHCVGELAEETGEGMSAVSQRLKLLHKARLLERNRIGKHIYYSLADNHVREILESVFDHVEENH